MKLSAGSEARELSSIDDRIMPLINIVFLLLIFFLVAGVIREVEPVEVDPPASTVEADDKTADLTLYVGADGQLAFDDRLLDETAFNAAIMASLAENPDRSVRIVADKAIGSGKVIAVLETLRTAGAARVRLTTRLQGAQ
jgi:biopolymer transport protein ExbD